MNLNRCWWAMVFCYFNYFRIKHWLKLFNKSSNLWPWNKPSLKGLVIFIKANGSNNTFDFTVHLLMVVVQTNPWEFSISFLNSKLSLCEFLVQCWMIAIYSAHLRDVNRQPSCVFGDQDWTSMGLCGYSLNIAQSFQTVLPSPVAAVEALGELSGSKTGTWDAPTFVILPIHPTSTHQHNMCSHSADRPLSFSCTMHNQ